MPTYYGDSYTTTWQQQVADQISQIRHTIATDSDGWQYYTPTPRYPRHVDFLEGCTCGNCSAVLRTRAMVDHFTPAYIPFHPTDDYINATPIKDIPVINPLPAPNVIHIRSRYDSTLVLKTITADTLAGYNFNHNTLEGADFTGMDLTGASFYGCTLRNASFANATIDGACFHRTRLSDSTFHGASAVEADFTLANLDYSDFRNADFTRAVFTRASLYSTMNTSSAEFEGATFSGASGVQQCDNCEYMEFRNTGAIRYCEDIGENRCDSCGYEQCEYCQDYFDDCDYHTENCSSRRHHALHEYDYAPYRFRPKGNFPVEPLMGVELEIGGDEYNLTSIVNNIDPAENHLYCKHDGSVDGIEVVTHPMTLNWAKQSFNFKGLLDNLSQIGHSSDGYGIHVHVSRNAFRGVLPDGSTTKKAQPQHQMAWLMFMYRNADSISRIARRTSDNWASWRKPGKGELKRKAAQPDSSTGRYVAINCENDKTYEVRVFRSTLNFTEFMAAIEMVDASVNYTRNLTTFDVLHNQAMSWTEFHKWCVAQGARYSSLLNQMKVQATL